MTGGNQKTALSHLSLHLYTLSLKTEGVDTQDPLPRSPAPAPDPLPLIPCPAPDIVFTSIKLILSFAQLYVV